MEAVVRFLCAVLFVSTLSFSAVSAHTQVTATAPVTEQSEYTNRWDICGVAQYSHFNPSPGRNIASINPLGWTGGAGAYFRPVWETNSIARLLRCQCSAKSRHSWCGGDRIIFTRVRSLVHRDRQACRPIMRTIANPFVWLAIPGRRQQSKSGGLAAFLLARRAMNSLRR